MPQTTARHPPWSFSAPGLQHQPGLAHAGPASLTLMPPSARRPLGAREPGPGERLPRSQAQSTNAAGQLAGWLTAMTMGPTVTHGPHCARFAQARGKPQVLPSFDTPKWKFKAGLPALPSAAQTCSPHCCSHSWGRRAGHTGCRSFGQPDPS